jgi:hypothetical protein
MAKKMRSTKTTLRWWKTNNNVDTPCFYLSMKSTYSLHVTWLWALPLASPTALIIFGEVKYYLTSPNMTSKRTRMTSRLHGMHDGFSTYVILMGSTVGAGMSMQPHISTIGSRAIRLSRT